MWAGAPPTEAASFPDGSKTRPDAMARARRSRGFVVKPPFGRDHMFGRELAVAGAVLMSALGGHALAQPSKAPVATPDAPGDCALCVEDSSGRKNCEPHPCGDFPRAVGGALRLDPSRICHVEGYEGAKVERGCLLPPAARAIVIRPRGGPPRRGGWGRPPFAPRQSVAAADRAKASLFGPRTRVTFSSAARAARGSAAGPHGRLAAWPPGRTDHSTPSVSVRDAL